MWRIEAGYKDRFRDSIGLSVKKDINEDLKIPVEDVKYIDVYTLDIVLTNEQAEMIADKLASDPITQEFSINKRLRTDFDWEIEVKLHEDVTDNVGIIMREAIKDLGIELQEGDEVKASRKYLLKGRLSEEEIEKICKGLLANETIETYKYEKLMEGSTCIVEPEDSGIDEMK